MIHFFHRILNNTLIIVGKKRFPIVTYQMNAYISNLIDVYKKLFALINMLLYEWYRIKEIK